MTRSLGSKRDISGRGAGGARGRRRGLTKYDFRLLVKGRVLENICER